MPDVLKTASAWLEAQRVAFRTIPVHYVRGSQSVPVNATVSRSTFELDDGSGGILRIETRDYLIAAAELAAGGVAFPPKAGDQVVEPADGGGDLTYEVIMPGQREPAWRWSDRYRQRLRVYTALTGTSSS